MLVKIGSVLLLAIRSPSGRPSRCLTPSGPSACQVDCWSLCENERRRPRHVFGLVLRLGRRHDQRADVGEDREAARWRTGRTSVMHRMQREARAAVRRRDA